MTSCCCWFIQPASEISKSRKGSRARVIATSYTPERPLARQTALSLAFCFQRDRVFGHYVVGVVVSSCEVLTVCSILPFTWRGARWLVILQVTAPSSCSRLSVYERRALRIRPGPLQDRLARAPQRAAPGGREASLY